ncbi:hypothetical protein V1527DRAFT_413123, partial [Lipomyces starkeyi]
KMSSLRGNLADHENPLPEPFAGPGYFDFVLIIVFVALHLIGGTYLSTQAACREIEIQCALL